MTVRRRPVRVACVGHASLDHVFTIDAFPGEQPTKTPARRYQAQGGGMSFNAAVAAARLGAEVRLLGRVGDDAAATLLRDQLQREGVDARGLEAVAGAATSVCAIVVDRHGQRQVFNHRGDAIARAHTLDTRQLEGADLVLTDPRWVAGAEQALRWARSHGVPALLDADVAPRSDLRRLVPLAQWAVFSEAGWGCWSGGPVSPEGLSAVCALGCEAAVVTVGEAGSWHSDGGPARHTPAFPVQARDTTAAGDVFHAALALALAEGRPADAALRWASAAAAFKCEAGGGVFGAPRRRALERWLRGR